MFQSYWINGLFVLTRLHFWLSFLLFVDTCLTPMVIARWLWKAVSEELRLSRGSALASV